MIVGLYSPVPQSGKSTVANVFVEEGFELRSLAEPVKESLEVVLKGLGIPDYKEYLYGSKKDKVIPGLYVTGGYLMSTYATIFMRDMIHEDTWLNILKKKIEPGKNYIVDDMRFPNEYHCFDVRIRLYRPSRLLEGHKRYKNSEGQLDNFSFEYTIMNDGTEDELVLRTQNVIKDLAAKNHHLWQERLKW